MDRPHVCLCGHKSEAKLKELSFTEEVNTSGNLHWMLGCVGLPCWHVHYRSRTTFVYFFASDLYPACLCCGKALGGKTRVLSSSWQSPCLTDTKPQCSRVEGCPGKLTSFVRILRPHLRPQYYPANGVVSSRERETAVNTLELPTAAVACLVFPYFFHRTTSASAIRGFYQFKRHRMGAASPRR